MFRNLHLDIETYDSDKSFDYCIEEYSSIDNSMYSESDHDMCQSDTEYDIFKPITKSRNIPSIEEMDAEYEAFLQAEYEAKENAMIAEISAWVEQGNQVFGNSLDEHYDSMCKQRIENFKILEQQDKLKKEQEERDRAKAGEEARLRLSQKVQRTRSEKSAKINAKGKNQGTSQNPESSPKGRRAIRKEKLEKEKEFFGKNVDDIIKKPISKLVKLEDIISDLPELDEELELDSPTVENLVDKVVDSTHASIITTQINYENSVCEYIENIHKQKKDADDQHKKEKESWIVIGRPRPRNKKIILDLEDKPTLQKPVAPILQRHPSELKTTRLCKSLINNTTCIHGDKCLFAHSIDQLVRVSCQYDSRCRCVRTVGNGIYQNVSGKGKINLVCNYWHPSETIESYTKRIGLNHNKIQSTFNKKVQPTVNMPLKPKVQPPVEVTVSPKVKASVEVTVSPKVQCPVEVPVSPKVQDSVEIPVSPKVQPPVEVTVSPKVQCPVEVPVSPKVNNNIITIRVPKELAKMTIATVLSKGIKNFHLELY